MGGLGRYWVGVVEDGNKVERRGGGYVYVFRIGGERRGIGRVRGE